MMRGCCGCGCALLLLAFALCCLLAAIGIVTTPPPAAAPAKHVEPISEWNSAGPEATAAPVAK
jgi:hypothetical protein